MPSNTTRTASVADSMPLRIASARKVREFPGGMMRLVDRRRLGKGTGHTWYEVDFAQLNATTGITETTHFDNPQEITDTRIGLTPEVIGIQTLITRETGERMSAVAAAEMGGLAQAAMNRQVNDDGLALATTAAVSLPGAGSTMTSGVISALVTRVEYGGGNEPGQPPFYWVAHPYHIKDVHDEITAGVGTYPIDSGLTENVFRNGFRGMLANAQVVVDGNIVIDAAVDAAGLLFAGGKGGGLILVQGRSPWMFNRVEEHIGGGADSVFHYDEYVWGERSAGNWFYGALADATVPSS